MAAESRGFPGSNRIVLFVHSIKDIVDYVLDAELRLRHRAGPLSGRLHALLQGGNHLAVFLHHVDQVVPVDLDFLLEPGLLEMLFGEERS